ncbi:hypothetical protein PAP_03395 [Palaeococcus pacificus DY20341]|uniref:KaiC domain-containing protein n=1 Tax=Palaeococcus pacificus DY20341 TaxID=1343739 RepID=A0A075LS49_9EURY|nr:ATPase domain-containing protein [Palaeococcus pacificus]AIF69099.1 hypothetical protein PAP_03395 [Palaeococcus pacificus DY20341]
MKRVSTGVKGLDKMLMGGLIPGRAYLIKGSPGSGKTTLAMHFLMEGVRNGENVLYITLEEPLELIKVDMEKLGFDMENPKLKTIDATPIGEKTYFFQDTFYEDFGKSFEKLTRAIEEQLTIENYTRIVIDPVTMLKLTIPNELEYRRVFISFLKNLAGQKATVLLISEIGNASIEDYLVSGVIELRSLDVRGKTIRGVKITKFRGSMFDEQMRPYKITKKGIKVYSEEIVFQEG